jgi:hypothetical protein
MEIHIFPEVYDRDLGDVILVLKLVPMNEYLIRERIRLIDHRMSIFLEAGKHLW